MPQALSRTQCVYLSVAASFRKSLMKILRIVSSIKSV